MEYTDKKDVQELLNPEEIDFINGNRPLLEYIRRLHDTSRLLNSQLKWMVLGTLISADTIVSHETAKKSLDELAFMRDNYDRLGIDPKDFAKLSELVESGIDICTRDMEHYSRQE